MKWIDVNDENRWIGVQDIGGGSGNIGNGFTGV